ncbi:MAG: hypothetical protein RDV41_05730 [Planctomycetota bacterium]|nr:hypothetical protein [Planctomycetota bacterium]
MLPKILIVYCYTHEYPMRAAIGDHLYSLRRYSGAQCSYVNTGMRRLPEYLLQIPFDLIVFHTTFLSQRWSGSEHFRRLVAEVHPLADMAAVKIALPQDEFIYCDDLCRFVSELKIAHVYSVAPAQEWSKIYAGVDFAKVRFHEALTGYLDEDTVNRAGKTASTTGARPIDIGYRAYRAPQWLGRHGFLKTQIADVFLREAPKYGLNVDISTRPEDTFLGNDWFRFLSRCKYLLGVEGGASVMDRDGSIKRGTEDFLAANPRASFDKIESACFPGAEGSLRLMAISPRHLEACATRTCQVLIEGKYNDILRPGVHYIELKRDFSNLREVLSVIKEDGLRRELVENAYRDVVETRRYTYRTFVHSIMKTTLPHSAARDTGSTHDARTSPAQRRADIAEALDRARLAFRWRLLNPMLGRLFAHTRSRLKRGLSDDTLAVLRRLKRALERVF